MIGEFLTSVPCQGFVQFARELLRLLDKRGNDRLRVLIGHCATTIMVTGRIASRTNVTQFSMSDASCDEAAASSTPAKIS